MPPPGSGTPTTGGPQALGAAPIEVARQETRRAVREARRRRRRLLAACGFVVALCLALTILVVSMARQRPSGLPASRPAALLSLAAQGLRPSLGSGFSGRPLRHPIHPVPGPGAVAPAGGGT